MTKLTSMRGLLAGSACLALLAATPALAGTVTWTTWSDSFTASPNIGTGVGGGSASGTAGAVGVTYTGELDNIQYSSAGGAVDWSSPSPGTTYIGGTVGNAPIVAEGAIQIQGGNSDTIDTITFSKPVTNPIIAIWSLGQPGDPASFRFLDGETITVEATGPDSPYGGNGFTTITSNLVTDDEGGGTVQIDGTFTSISWSTPQHEDYYDFTVGVSSVPEPASWALLLVGFAGLGGALRARRTSPARA